MNHKANKQEGFTLIELVLAMSFIAVLLLAIAMTIIQIGNIYNRGTTLKEVNEAGRTLSTEFSRDFTSSESFSLVATDQRYVTSANGGRATGGQLCMGQYSYIWNYGKDIVANGATLAKLADGTVVHFVRVNDSGGNYCLNPNAYKTIAVADAPYELLKVGDRNLTIHQFDVSSGANAYDASTGQRLYSVTYTIGTNDLTALNATQTACRPPGDLQADLAYCSIQQFTLVLRAGNRVN
ncbi:MAG: prepilin-type N-terminal cleavage/methylation domain-containing protein [Candidatus Saccharimonadales bacterium]